jgi:hypothetical protein
MRLERAKQEQGDCQEYSGDQRQNEKVQPIAKNQSSLGFIRCFQFMICFQCHKGNESRLYLLSILIQLCIGCRWKYWRTSNGRLGHSKW